MSVVHTLRLPYPAYLRIVIRRSVVMWLLVRLLLLVLLTLVIGFRPALEQPALGIPALLVWLDRRIFGELLLHANLGASELWFWGVSLVVVLGLDVLAGFVLAQL